METTANDLKLQPKTPQLAQVQQFAGALIL
jgi:hypothetical protein